MLFLNSDILPQSFQLGDLELLDWTHIKMRCLTTELQQFKVNLHLEFAELGKHRGCIMQLNKQQQKQKKYTYIVHG